MPDLSIGANISWQIAAHEAAAAKFQFIEKEHLFIGICSLEKILKLSPEDSGLNPESLKALQKENAEIQDLMEKLGLNTAHLRRRLRKRFGSGNYTHTKDVVHRSESCKKVFKHAYELAFSNEQVTCLHLLGAMLKEPGGHIVHILQEADVKEDAFLERVLSYISKKEPVQEKEYDSATPYLDRYGRDLNKAAREGRLGPFVGRRNELLQVIQSLARSMKNNPVLVGEPGVGKTAVVEALAVRVVQGKDSQALGGKRIIELNMGSLIGGTKYRGEFEERLAKIIEEASSNPDIIIFIDEIHNLVGAGQGSGSMDAANLMKPALSKGEIKCIGATTISEYRKYIESDPALERRFEKIIVNEPNRGETIEILKGIRSKWEKHFNKKITDKALEAAVDLSIRFDTDHYLPDKAVDLVDKAGARMQVPFLSMMQPGKGVEIKSEGKAGYAEVTELAIAQVLSDKINVPLEIIAGHIEGKESRLLELNSFLKKRIIGQDEAIDKVSQRLLLAHTGIGKKTGPLAVLLFLGPTGVGKTETAKSLSEFLFGSQSNLIRMDMSEFMEEHSVAKLIGSPPGYVGYGEEGQLTGKLRTKPYSVVLMDEIEKAHPKIFDIFLQVFDEGRITDSKGRTVDAKNIIFIMTSNLGHTEQRKKGIGFLEQDEESKHEISSEIKKFFRPELINRIDEQIVFQPLGEDNVREILKTMLNEISADVEKRYNIKIKITNEAERFISQKGYSQEYGVRELRRTVERFVQIPLSNLILSGKIKEQRALNVILRNEEIQIASADEKT